MIVVERPDGSRSFGSWNWPGKSLICGWQVKYVLIPTQRAPSFEVYKRGPNKGRRKPGEVLEKECAYIADFVYTKGDETVVEDAKGVRTKEYIIKRKLMLERYGIRIKEV